MDDQFNPTEWKTIVSITHFESKYFSVISDQVLLPNNYQSEYIYVKKSPAIMVIPILDNNHVVLVKQYRYIIERNSWEFPAGSIKEGELPEDAALRELQEETGYISENINLITKAFTSTGTTNEVVYYYYAQNLRYSSKKLDITEFDITTGIFSIPECLEMLEKGDIFCAGTALALLYLNYMNISKF